MLNPNSAILFVLNYALGSYFLIYPWVFNNAGYALSIIMCILILVMYLLLGNMILEQTSRGECYMRLKDEGYHLPKHDAFIDYEIRPEISAHRSF